jgi:hypothetical protein
VSADDPPGQDLWDRHARGETREERLDRNFDELLQELRVAQTGVQILFAFLLSLVFATRFGEVTGPGLVVYGVAVVAAALAMALLTAPVAGHRLLFRLRARRALVAFGQWTTLAGLAMLSLAVGASLLLVLEAALGWAWAAVLTALVSGAFAVLWLGVPLSLRTTAERSTR